MQRRNFLKVALFSVGGAVMSAVGTAGRIAAATRTTRKHPPTTTTTVHRSTPTTTIPRRPTPTTTTTAASAYPTPAGAPVWPQIARVNDVAVGGAANVSLTGASGTVPGSKYANNAQACPSAFGTGYCNGQAILYRAASNSWSAVVAVCTHFSGSLTSDHAVAGKVTCMSHFSQFSLTDGHVIAGPAAKPLPTLKVEARSDGYVYWTGDN